MFASEVNDPSGEVSTSMNADGTGLRRLDVARHGREPLVVAGRPADRARELPRWPAGGLVHDRERREAQTAHRSQPQRGSTILQPLMRGQAFRRAGGQAVRRSENSVWLFTPFLGARGGGDHPTLPPSDRLTARPPARLPALPGMPVAKLIRTAGLGPRFGARQVLASVATHCPSTASTSSLETSRGGGSHARHALRKAIVGSGRSGPGAGRLQERRGLSQRVRPAGDRRRYGRGAGRLRVGTHRQLRGLSPPISPWR